MTQRTCPICARLTSETQYRPFCSRRCADVDLQRWFTGGYAIPASEAEAPPEQTADPGGGAAADAAD